MIHDIKDERTEYSPLKKQRNYADAKKKKTLHFVAIMMWGVFTPNNVAGGPLCYFQTGLYSTDKRISENLNRVNAHESTFEQYREKMTKRMCSQSTL